MDLRKILLISLGHLSCDLNGGALPSLMPYLAAAHGFNYQAAGALMFAYSATSSLVQPVFGYLADKHARSWFVPLAVLLAGGSLGIHAHLCQFRMHYTVELVASLRVVLHNSTQEFLIDAAIVAQSLCAECGH